MQLTKTLIDYLKDCHLRLNSNLLLTDLSHVILTDTFFSNDIYLNQSISDELLELIDDWRNRKFSNEMLLVLNKNLKKFIHNDKTNYSAQIIFPIFRDDTLQGLLLFFRTNGNYISTSSKAPKTIKFFIEKNVRRKLLRKDLKYG